MKHVSRPKDDNDNIPRISSHSLFRGIRKKLIHEGKLIRYLSYAIGEIVLIILGILFALKINDWNEEKKARVVETKILTEIRSNLNHDLDEIRNDITSLEDVVTACNEIIRFLETNDFPSAEFFENAGMLRVTPHFDPDRSGYDLLVSKGVEIVLNDNLRRSLSVLYQSRYTYYFRYEEERTRFYLHNTTPKLLEYFSWEYLPDTRYLNRFHISEEDYYKLKKDPAFLKLINAIIHEYLLIKNRAQGTENSIVDLIDQLNEELNEKGSHLN